MLLIKMKMKRRMKMSSRGFMGIIGAIVIVFVILIGLLMFTERVPEGKVAVVYSPSGGATEVLNPGWHVIGLFEKTQEYPTRVTIVKTEVGTTTQDGKKLTLPARYEFKVDKKHVLDIFKELGSQDIEQIQEGYLYQRLFKATRDTVADYSVLDIFGAGSGKASAEITTKMAENSKGLGFLVTDVTLGNPKVDKETQRAIDERVKAAQQLEKLKLDKQIAQETAEKKKIEAEGNAKAKIENARGEAEANRLLEQSITPELLKKLEMEARLKHGWITIQGASPLVEAKQ
jgi:regulator of protease activity HflC (stomatin/prohibitin superfamily)